MMDPKPTRRPPKPKKALRAKVWGVRRRPPRKQVAFAHPKPSRPDGTAHRRRCRELGRMLFYSGLWCMLRDIARTGNVQSAIIEMAEDCGTGVWGMIEVAHLGARGATGTGGWRRAPDRTTAPLCRKHHKAIDGKEGGRAPWFVAMPRHEQHELRQKLYTFASYYWDNLSADARARYDELARRRPVLPSGDE